MRYASTRVAFMDKGVIAEQGTPQELFENSEEERTKELLKQYLDNLLFSMISISFSLIKSPFVS